MSAIRALLIYDLRQLPLQCLFIKRWPSIITSTSKEDVPVPDHDKLAEYINKEISFRSLAPDEINLSDLSRWDSTPLYYFTTQSGRLGPVLLIESNPFLFCCICSADEESNHCGQKVDTLSVATVNTAVVQAFKLVTDMAQFLEQFTLVDTTISRDWTGFQMLHRYLAITCPFGRHLGYCPIEVKAWLGSAGVKNQVPAEGVSVFDAAQLGTAKGGAGVLKVTLSEIVDFISGPNRSAASSCRVSGRCSLALQGFSASALVSAVCGAAFQARFVSSTPLLVQQVCAAASLDQLPDDAFDTGARGFSTALSFNALTAQIQPCFDLLTYTTDVAGNSQPPLTAHFQLKRTTSSAPLVNTEFLLQFRFVAPLDAALFTYCNVELPAFGASIDSHECTCSTGRVDMQRGARDSLVWGVANVRIDRDVQISGRFVARHLSPDTAGAKTARPTAEDVFCEQGDNSFVTLRFEAKDVLLSRADVTFTSQLVKFKTLTTKCVQSGVCRVWNTKGEPFVGY